MCTCSLAARGGSSLFLSSWVCLYYERTFNVFNAYWLLFDALQKSFGIYGAGHMFHCYFYFIFFLHSINIVYCTDLFFIHVEFVFLTDYKFLTSSKSHSFIVYNPAYMPLIIPGQKFYEKISPIF